MLMLPLLAVALAVPPKRSSSGARHLRLDPDRRRLSQGQSICRAGRRPTASSTRSLALWVPLVLLAALIVWMYHVLAHQPGGQPIGALERFCAQGRQGASAALHAASARGRGMINLAFFPSRRLAFYMVRLFLTRSLAVLVALVLVLMTLDLLGESGKILAVPGNGDAELWRYVGASHAAAGLALPALLGAARHADRLRRPQPEQRGRGDEGGGPVGAPDPRAAGRRQHRHRRRLVRLQREAWWSSRRARSPPGPTTITSRSRRESGILSNVWVLNGDDLIRAGTRRRPRRRTSRRSGSPSTTAAAACSSA